MRILHVKTATNMIEQIVMTIVTTLVGYFVGRRKSNAETDNQVLRNLELSINLYICYKRYD